MTNQISQQSKPNAKSKAIAALVLGVISIIGGMITIYIYGAYGDWESNMILIIYSLIPITGIVFGKIGLNSTEKVWKGLSIGGILLSIIGLIGTIFVCILLILIALGM